MSNARVRRVIVWLAALPRETGADDRCRSVVSRLLKSFPSSPSDSDVDEVEEEASESAEMARRLRLLAE